MFKLNIECSRDIDFLKINFTDGTSVIQQAQESQESQDDTELNIPDSRTQNASVPETPIRQKTNSEMLDTDVSYEDIPQEIVELPEINSVRSDRNVSVASELQNLDI